MNATDRLRWFKDARYGLFIHWGPYSVYGRGEQVLFREHIDHNEYAVRACKWNPSHYDPDVWADTARKAGMKYAVLTTRHHDGYCLWNSRYTDYSSYCQAPKRDFVAEYVTAFRKAGLRVGLYYSLIDWRIPAYYLGPEKDPEGWHKMKTYIHEQVEELLTNYGEIDIIWFDGPWPRSSQDLDAENLISKMRRLQPHILINDRLGRTLVVSDSVDGGEGPGHSIDIGDFGTSEQRITPQSDKAWEACLVSGWRLWGYTKGERWRPADLLLDMLCECAEKDGNMLLNVGPQPDGQFPPEFVERILSMGRWLDIHGDAIFGTEGGNLTEFITRGRQTIKGKFLYLIIKYWDRSSFMRIPDIVTPLKKARLLTTGQELAFKQKGDEIILRELPAEAPTKLFPVIELEFASVPENTGWAKERLWSGDPERCVPWTETRGTSVWADGKERSGDDKPI